MSEWQPDETIRDLIRHVALQNALEYEGKAAVGSVIGRIMAMRDELKQHGKFVTRLVATEVNNANEVANEDGLEAIRTILQEEAPHLLEKREVKARREGLAPLNNATKGKVVLRFKFPTQTVLFPLVTREVSSSTARIVRCTMASSFCDLMTPTPK